MNPGAFRFFLAALVVIHHSFPLRMGSWAVYVFFILSGYWIAKMWEEKYRYSRRPEITFLASRWLRLAPVFFFTLVLGIVSSQILPVAPSLPEPIGYWLFRQIWIVGSSSAGLIIPPMWSLDVEMQFYLVFSILAIGYRVLSRLWLVVLVSGLSVVSVVLLLLNFGRGAEVGHGASISIYFWLFVAGMAIYLTNWRPKPWLAHGMMSLFWIITGMLLIFPQTRAGIWIRGAESVSPMQVGLDPVLLAQAWWVFGAILVLPFVAYNVNRCSDSFDRMLGNWAYPLYLFHWISRDWYYSSLDWQRPTWYNGILLLLNFGVALAGSWLILRFVDKPADRWRAKWVSSRMGVRRELDAESTVKPMIR